MLLSKLFTKTLREGPKDEVAKNASLLVRAGYVDKLAAGIYSYLPLGILVVSNLQKIVREELAKVDAQEIFMPALQPKENWLKTGRWETMDNLYKVTDSEGREFALGPTHEEVVVPLVQKFASSYRDLPLSVYQFQSKFRMELRSKSGLLRGREFLMKDMYSFHKSEDEMKPFYEKMKEVYSQIFKRAGLGEITRITFASGGAFSEFSHEFQAETPAGEDTIYVCESCDQAVNREIFKEKMKCPACKSDSGAYRETKAIEVGNIFELKTKFSDAFGMTYKDETGVEQPVIMGCYGIGIGRLIGTIVEALSDEKGIIWPEEVSPFDIHLVGLTPRAKDFYDYYTKKGMRVLYDDRDVSAGEKFADAELLGIPKRLVISDKTLKEDKIEWKDRTIGTITYEKSPL